MFGVHHWSGNDGFRSVRLAPSLYDLRKPSLLTPSFNNYKSNKKILLRFKYTQRYKYHCRNSIHTCFLGFLLPNPSFSKSLSKQLSEMYHFVHLQSKTGGVKLTFDETKCVEGESSKRRATGALQCRCARHLWSSKTLTLPPPLSLYSSTKTLNLGFRGNIY